MAYTKIAAETSGEYNVTKEAFGKLNDAIYDLKVTPRNVKDHGALGDGSTNDSAAFNDAITAVNSAGGGIVLVPRATYRIKNVDILDNVTVICEPGVVFKWPSGTVTFDRIFFIGQGNQRSNVQFIGNGCIMDPSDVSGYGSTVGALTGIAVEAAKDFRIEGIRGQNFGAGNIITLNATSAPAQSENGIVQHIRDYARTNGGYGCVQVTGAKNVNFKNLYSSGGYALNFESDRRSSGDVVEDCIAENLYADKAGSIGTAVVKFIAHGNTIRRIRVKSFTSFNSQSEGVYFASQGDVGGSLAYLTLEDGYISGAASSIAGIRRENGNVEIGDIPGLVFKRVTVTGSTNAGWALGSDAYLEDCEALNNGTDGFGTNANTSNKPGPFKIIYNKCRANGNGGNGFIHVNNVILGLCIDCESKWNGTRAFTTSGTTGTIMHLVRATYAHGQAGAYNGTSGTVYHDRDTTRKTEILGPYSMDNVPINQSAVALSSVDPPGAAGAVTTAKMDRNGSIVGILARIRNYGDGRTAGTMTLTVFKNGATLTTPLTAILDATNPRYNMNWQGTGVAGATFVSGDTISIRVTTDASWAPTTADIDAWVIISED